jgi:phosphatidate cytidylyltransferase
VLKHRLVFGTLLALGIGAILFVDRNFAPYYPCLFACALGMAILASRELRDLLDAASRPRRWLAVGGTVLLIAAHWGHLLNESVHSWQPIGGLFVALVLIAFLVEMALYRGPGTPTPRIAATVFLFVYLGILPGFLVALRWHDHAELLLTLTIFVPKCGDIGAYFTGHAIGRHKFTPLLSPKKTWEGFAGGMLASMAVSVGLSFAAPVFRYGIPEAAAYGAVVGLAGVLGDLAESMIKRDAGSKDAGSRIPGFGGILDVIDSILFAAPVSYLWLTR